MDVLSMICEIRSKTAFYKKNRSQLLGSRF